MRSEWMDSIPCWPIAHCGRKHDHQFSKVCYFQGRIYIKVEHPCLCALSQLLFSAPDLPNTYAVKNHKFFGPPPKGSKEPPSASKELPKSSSGDEFYILKLPINRKATVTSKVLTLNWRFVKITCKHNPDENEHVNQSKKA